jgi:hypothetical protein
MEFLSGNRAGFKPMPGLSSGPKNPADDREKDCRRNENDGFEVESHGGPPPI